MRHTLAAIDAASSTGESLQMDEHRQRQTSGDRIGASLGRDNWDYSSMRQSPSISPPPASRVGTPSCSVTLLFLLFSRVTTKHSSGIAGEFV